MPVIHIGSDHAGFEMKNILAKELPVLGYTVTDHGARSAESCDYPLIAHDLCNAVAKDGTLGILICGTGTGMSITANRHPEIRAALCANELQARLARRHNNANVLCLGARLVGNELAIAIMTAFLESHFEGGRHQRRIDEININEINIAAR